MRDFINIVETKLVFPTKSFDALWHVGSLEASNKKQNSLEGSGLSVSIHPEEWRRIARGHVSGDTWRCSKLNNKFLDYLKLNANQKRDIIKWAISKNYVTVGTVWRYYYWDEELEQEVYQEFSSKEEAVSQSEFDDDPKIRKINNYRSVYPTQKFKNRTLNTQNIVNPSLVVSIWAEDTTDFDGVWWNEKLQPENYSAPRGVIFKSKLKSWEINKVDGLAP